MAVRYAVEGGYAHLPREVVVGEDGAVAVDRAAPGWSGSGRPPTWPPWWRTSRRPACSPRTASSGQPTGADRQRYEVVCAGVTVVAYDGTLPAELAAVLARLDAELARP